MESRKSISSCNACSCCASDIFGTLSWLMQGAKRYERGGLTECCSGGTIVMCLRSPFQLSSKLRAERRFSFHQIFAIKKSQTRKTQCKVRTLHRASLV